MDGILLVDKPVGMTSHDVVAKVRRIVSEAAGKKVKVGHTGTLDPLASGFLILVIGSYTKRAQEFSKLDKTYEVELTLGATSTTGDAEGDITPLRVRPLEGLTDDRIKTVLGSFLGQIEQTPPIYSAVKIGGQRAYKLARQGKKPELKPRQVTVHRLQVTDYKYPKLSFTTEVSSGTYIRSLAGDIGRKLGTGAYVSALHRTKIGHFNVKDALALDNLDTKTVQTEIAKSD